jgi:phosphate transport system substrate-binding protein
MRTLLPALALVLSLLSSCQRIADKSPESATSGRTGSIEIDGSSSALPLTENLVAEFRQLSPDIAVNVGNSGTSEGFQKFCAGYVDVMGVSRPIKAVEADACSKKEIEYIELPIAYDGIVVVVNPKNTWVDYMTTAELRKMWDVKSQGKVLKWSEIRPAWPDRDIHLFGPDPESGTYDYFTRAINGAEGVGRGDFTASEDENVLVSGVSRDELGFAYFGCAYYERNKDKLKLVAIEDLDSAVKAGPVVFSPETVLNGTYQPLTRPLLMYVNAQYAKRAEVSGFVDFYLKNATKAASDGHYVPMPARVYAQALERFRDRSTRPGPRSSTSE